MLELPPGYTLQRDALYLRIRYMGQDVPRGVVVVNVNDDRYQAFIRRNVNQEPECRQDFDTEDEALRYALAMLMLG